MKSAAAALLAEARALTDARLAACGERLRTGLGGQDGEAAAYALGTTGKRVRPALLLASYRAVGGQSSGVAGLAAAVEIVHTYSLVHDDLPCMDDAAQRRGRPTTHVRFDVATATRVGFLLVPAAVEELVAAAAELRLSPDETGRLAGELLEAGGIRGMVGGQWLDLEAERGSPSLEALTEMHRRKTGALIEAACGLGGLAGRAGAEPLAAIKTFGREVGLAFQIADDVLDATATTAQLGKTAGRDATLAKSTYVSLLGVEGALHEARRHTDNAVGVLRGVGIASEPLEALARYIHQRRA